MIKAYTSKIRREDTVKIHQAAEIVESHVGFSAIDEPRPEGRGMIWEGFRTPPKFGSE